MEDKKDKINENNESNNSKKEETIENNKNQKEDKKELRLDDNFLDSFEKEMLQSSDGIEKISIDSILQSTDDEYTEKIEKYIDNSDNQLDINELPDNVSLEDININLDNIDVSKIDLSKLKIKGLDVDNINIGFDLDKLKLDNYDIDVSKVNPDKIKFDDINLDLGSIISFENNINELKKMNILLTSPVKGFYGFFFLNPYQELRNAFKKSYNQILQLTRPAEAFQSQLNTNSVIDSKEVLKAQKKLILNEKKEKMTDKDIEDEVNKELEKELGKDWDVQEEKNKKSKEAKFKNLLKEKKILSLISYIVSSIFIFMFRLFRGTYLRLYLMSLKAKLIILIHLFLLTSFGYLVKEYATPFMKLVYSSREKKINTNNMSLVELSKTLKNPNKRLLGPIVTIDKIICSFPDKIDNQKSKQLEISLYIEVNNFKAQAELYNNTSKIKDGIISLIGKKDLFSMKSTITKEHLKIEIIDYINKFLKQGKALKVYYRKFVIN